MRTYAFKLPDVGEGITEAELVAWHIAVGDRVREDQPIADVMTGKATVEVTAPVSGRVTALHGEVGKQLAIGSVLAEFALDATVEAPPAAPVVAKNSERAKASPVVRRMAAQQGVGLADVAGTGPHGRVLKADLQNYLTSRSGGPKVQEARREEFKDVPLSPLRRRIAEKMEIAARHIPHFSYVEEIDVTALEEARERLNLRYEEQRGKLTLIPFLIRALIMVLPQYPQINATYDEEAKALRQFRDLHIGIATQTRDGLIVPVLRHAERLSLWELAGALKQLTEAARAGRIKADALQGSTITITSLGKLGGIAATPVINHPEVAIIGPNRIQERPALIGGALSVRKVMNISSSFDHRAVDGYDAAAFIHALKDLLEDPAALLAG